MAIQQRIPVAFEGIFPAGAYMVGEVEALEDYDALVAAKNAGKEPGDIQLRDKVTGLRVWQVRVVDADPEARKGETELVIKIGAEVQPVPPPKMDGLPFRPVVFEGLTLTTWIDESRSRPKVAYSIRATAMAAPKGKGTSQPSGNGNASGSAKAAA
ncbi:plasmid replication, integration and excision activator [Oryzihumus leptocrescens]|uniref:Plasmid replication, integration and excision activator n=1 Tax=Oryzihumus leptocrescens TaxID=297536 RepID=A0A542Z9U6_9MICO|nr:plasmid replication, integration and excision activator [Oryzihumus leptocrescens]TQL57096.1 hypothetical protein FB474_3870 [Oryzihumus leptocrescens]